MEIDEDYLKEMMLEYWALDNNEECHKATVKFCDMYNIDLDEINFEREYI